MFMKMYSFYPLKRRCHRLQEPSNISVLNTEKRLCKKRGILSTSIQNILKLDHNSISVNKEGKMFSKFQLKLNKKYNALISIKTTLGTESNSGHFRLTTPNQECYYKCFWFKRYLT